MSSLLYTGDIGAKIVVDTENTSAPTTTTFTLIVTDPTGATAEWGGTMDYATGEITYYTQDGDLPEGYHGQYVAQVRSVSDDGSEVLKSNKATFYVYEPEF